MSKFNRSPDRYIDGFNGKVAKGRQSTPSSYEGDQGGAAGGAGLPHGLGGGPSMQPMLGHGYAGAPISFEGGVRGGGVSECETMPAQYPYPKKVGYDEHRSRTGGPMGAAGGNVHGLPGVEGIDPVIGLPAPEHGMAGDDDGDEGDGYACPHGCGSMKSRHGLARHVHARHGFGGLGRALHPTKKKHGTSYTEGQEFRGESDDAGTQKKIKAEFLSREPAKSSSY